MITIPYTWTQGRQVLVSPATPSVGFWYVDGSDPEHQGGAGKWVYRAVPWWLALEHAYTRDRKLLVLMSAPTDDGQRGRLRVYRQGEENPPTTLTEYTELESNDVSGAALGVRGSGEVDVFYIHGGALKHRLSRDGGETFESATTLALTSFTPDVATLPPSTNGWDVEAQARGGFVTFDYLATGGIALCLTGRLTGATDGDRPHLVKGEWDAGADRWTFGTLGKLSSAAGYQGLPYRLQAMPTGDVWTLPFGQRVTKLTWEGTFTLVGSLVIGAGTRQMGGVGVSGGQMLAFEGLDAFPPGSASYRLRRLYSFRWNGATNQWAFAGQAATAERLQVWAKRYTSGSSDQYITTKASKWYFRENRTWEYLYLAVGEVPTLIRFPAGIPIAGTPLTWE